MEDIVSSTGALTFSHFVTWGFLALLTGAVSLCYKSIRETSECLKKMSESVCSLNSQLAVNLERLDWHQREIEDCVDRIKRLENRSAAMYDS